MGDEPKGQDLESFSFNLGRRRYHFYDVVFVLGFRCFFFPEDACFQWNYEVSFCYRLPMLIVCL